MTLPLKPKSPVRPRGLGLHLQDSTPPPHSLMHDKHEERKQRRQGVDIHSHAEFSEILTWSEDGRSESLNGLQEAAESDDDARTLFSLEEKSLFGEVENLLMNAGSVETSFRNFVSTVSPPPSLDSLLETPPPDLPLPLTPPETSSPYRHGLTRGSDRRYVNPDVAVFDPNESMARLEMSLAKLGAYKSHPTESCPPESTIDHDDDDDESVYSNSEEVESFHGVGGDRANNQDGKDEAQFRGRDVDDDDGAHASSLQPQLWPVVLSITASSSSPQPHTTTSVPAMTPNANSRRVNNYRVMQPVTSSFTLLPRFDFEKPEPPAKSLLLKDLPPTPPSTSPVEPNSTVSLPSLAVRNTSMPRLPHLAVSATPKLVAQPMYATAAGVTKPKQDTTASPVSERPSLSRRRSKSVPFLLRSVRNQAQDGSSSSSTPTPPPVPPVPPRTAAHAILSSRVTAPQFQKVSLSQFKSSSNPLTRTATRLPETRTPPRETVNSSTPAVMLGSFMNLTPEEEKTSVVGKIWHRTGTPLRDKLGKGAGMLSKKQKSSRWLRGSIQV